LEFYLKKGAQSSYPLNIDRIVPTLDLYRYVPWEIPSYWKAMGLDRAIHNKLLHCIGLKKILEHERIWFVRFHLVNAQEEDGYGAMLDIQKGGFS